jgi:hypothetical protein
MTTRLGPGICSKLRTKTMYLNVDQREDAEEPGCNGTAIFWCLKTHECLGPDDQRATPEDCTSSRACAVVLPEV